MHNYIFDACKTGQGGYNANNLCYSAYLSGVDCVLGWKGIIYSDDSYVWQQRFQSRLIAGDSVCMAATYANTFNDYSYNSLMWDWIGKGDSNIVVYKGRSASVFDKEPNYHDMSSYEITASDTHSESLISAIQKLNKNFDAEDYELHISYTKESNSDFVAHYTYVHNGFMTSSGYAVVVQNGKVTAIRDNTIALSASIRSVPASLKEKKSLAYNKASIKMLEIGSDCVLDEQVILPYYDIETDRYYYNVLTSYKTANGAYGTYSTQYELQ